MSNPEWSNRSGHPYHDTSNRSSGRSFETSHQPYYSSAPSTNSASRSRYYSSEELYGQGPSPAPSYHSNNPYPSTPRPSSRSDYYNSGTGGLPSSGSGAYNQPSDGYFGRRPHEYSHSGPMSSTSADLESKALVRFTLTGDRRTTSVYQSMDEETRSAFQQSLKESLDQLVNFYEAKLRSVDQSRNQWQSQSQEYRRPHVRWGDGYTGNNDDEDTGTSGPPTEASKGRPWGWGQPGWSHDSGYSSQRPLPPPSYPSAPTSPWSSRPPTGMYTGPRPSFYHHRPSHPSYPSIYPSTPPPPSSRGCWTWHDDRFNSDSGQGNRSTRTPFASPIPQSSASVSFVSATGEATGSETHTAATGQSEQESSESDFEAEQRRRRDLFSQLSGTYDKPPSAIPTAETAESLRSGSFGGITFAKNADYERTRSTLIDRMSAATSNSRSAHRSGQPSAQSFWDEEASALQRSIRGLDRDRYGLENPKYYYESCIDPSAETLKSLNEELSRYERTKSEKEKRGEDTREEEWRIGDVEAEKSSIIEALDRKARWELRDLRV